MFKVKTIYVLVLFISAVENCTNPCNCDSGSKKITCSESTTKLYTALTTIPVVTSSVAWNDLEISNHQELINITKNEFQYAGLHNLIYISINFCGIRNIHEEAFNNLTNLHTLDLSHNRIRKLYDKTFQPVKSIQFLILNHNRLEAIDDKIFADLTKLQNLEICDNNLAVFSENALVNNQKLKQLYLDNNKLTSFDMDVIETIETFNTLKIANNSWTCDCQLHKFYDFMRKNSKLDLVNNICYAPDSLKGRSLKNITKDDLKCWLRVSLPLEKEEATLGQPHRLCCKVDSNTRPNKITWEFKNKVISNTSEKYKFSTQPTSNQVIYWYQLTIANISEADKGNYKCIFENRGLEDDKEIKLHLKDKPFDAATTIIIVMIIFCIICTILIIFKCFIRCHIVKNTNEAEPHYQETSKTDNEDQISIYSLKSEK